MFASVSAFASAPHRHWLQALAACEEPCVTVVVALAEGSTPRASGARMLITAADQWGTIGGGHLELKAVQMARELLAEHRASPARGLVGAESRTVRFALGPSLGQCCGGAATLLFEVIGIAQPAWVRDALARRAAGEVLVLASPVNGLGAVPANVSGRIAPRLISRGDAGCEVEDSTGDARCREAARELLDADDRLAVLVDTSDDLARWQASGSAFKSAPEPHGLVLLERIAPEAFEVVVFGAGHVGQALVSALSLLPCRVTWVDSRPEVFALPLPPAVQALVMADPLDQVALLAPGSFVLVLTHSHALDQDLCERLLRRADTAYLGLIGSATKRATFERRMTQRGLDPALFAALTCPIGIPGIDGKEPAVIAAAVVAQLLQVRESWLLARPRLRDMAARARQLDE